MWTYPPDLLDILLTFGLAPTPDTPPRLVRDALNDLYRYEIRRLRQRLLDKEVVRADYAGLVVQLRKKYWPLSLTPDGWERLASRSPGPSRSAQAPSEGPRGESAE
jgi:hypothetical protein